MSSQSDSDGMGSIPATPNARNVPLFLCHQRTNEASLYVKMEREIQVEITLSLNIKYFYI